MTKQEFLTKVQSKPGFVRIVSDSIAPDSRDSEVDKKFLTVQVQNEDGTNNYVNVFYTENKATLDVNFFALEPVSFTKETDNQKKQDALETYLKGKYAAFFITRFDFQNNWAEADVYVQGDGNVSKKTVLVFKRGANPITDVDIV